MKELLVNLTTFLMFEGRAEEAMNFYISLFPNSRVVAIERYGADEAGPEGSVKRADFELNGTPLMCIDSPGKHAFTFTPSMSLFIECDDEAQLDHFYDRFSDGGQTMMPPDNYGFSRKFTWVQDTYGVSWQLNLNV
jgi:predicted 3-demethylubiquinone-9 3-methyltransferase (glyoxalase superfamily)